MNRIEKDARNIFKFVSNLPTGKPKKEMSYERKYPFIQVDAHGNEKEVIYTPDKWHEMQKICDNTFNDAKREFMEITHVYVSDIYFADNLKDDWFENYERKEKLCENWIAGQCERDALENLCDCEYSVVSEDAIEMGWMPEEALYKESLRGKISILDIIQPINKKHHELNRKYFNLSECVADIYYSDSEQIDKSIHNAIQNSSIEAMINCSVHMKNL